jgi:hypothetical protein
MNELKFWFIRKLVEYAISLLVAYLKRQPVVSETPVDIPGIGYAENVYPSRSIEAACTLSAVVIKQLEGALRRLTRSFIRRPSVG